MCDFLRTLYTHIFLSFSGKLDWSLGSVEAGGSLVSSRGELLWGERRLGHGMELGIGHGLDEGHSEGLDIGHGRGWT